MGNISTKDAVKKLETSAASGDVQGQEELIDIFYFGLNGHRKNYSKAIKWARVAASKSPHAQSCLGNAYDNGNGVTKDLKQSVLWFTKAAKNGDAYAQTALAYAYEYGNGVQKSPRTAIYWYKQAAEQKYIPAMYNLAQWYSENGKGDMRKAVEWWRKAAKGDHREAQCNLGGAYETGRGIRRSLPQAIRWYRQALKLGDKLAKNNLARIRRTGQAEDSTVWRK